MLQKRMFKVMARVEKRGGGSFLMRVGSGYANKDDSFNIFLDAMPKSFELHMRELDADDLRKREDHGHGAPPPAPVASASAAGIPF